MEERILVCGSGPSLPKQLNSVNLDSFGTVVRVGMWQEIEGQDNRCDAWMFYPAHSQGEMDAMPLGMEEDIRSRSRKVNELWLGYPGTTTRGMIITRRFMDYVISVEGRAKFCTESGLAVPRPDILALHMAMLRSKDVWAAGFDFYEGDTIYFSDEKPKEHENPYPHDLLLKEKEWFMEQVRLGRVEVL